MPIHLHNIVPIIVDTIKSYAPTTFSISGTVYKPNGSTAVSGATVALGAYSAVSAANGTYTISSIPAGTSGSMTCTLGGYNWTAISISAMSGNLTGQNYTANWDLLTNLIAYWKLDETSDGSGPITRNDSIGTLHLTDTNTVPSVAGKINNAASFLVANSEQLVSAANTTLAAGAGVSFEAEAWIQRRADLNMSIVTKTAAWDIQYSNGAQRFRASFRKADNSGTVTLVANALGLPALNTWYHVVIWHDAVNDIIGIRVNDQYEDTTAYTFDVFNTSNTFVIGNGNFIGFFTGYVDGVGFWQRVRSAADRTASYNGGAGWTPPF